MHFVAPSSKVDILKCKWGVIFPPDLLCVDFQLAAISCLLYVAVVSIQVKVKNLTFKILKTQFCSTQKQRKKVVIEREEKV